MKKVTVFEDHNVMRIKRDNVCFDIVINDNKLKIFKTDINEFVIIEYSKKARLPKTDKDLLFDGLEAIFEAFY